MILGHIAKWLGEETAIDPQLIHPLQPWMNIPRLHHLLPYQSYNPMSKLFYNKGSTGFVLMGCPIVGAGFEDQGQIAHFLAQEHNIKEGTSLQFLLIASPKIGPVLQSWQAARKPGIFQELAERR